MNGKIKFIDLFAGVGGFRIGLENANKYGLERCNGNKFTDEKSKQTEFNKNVRLRKRKALQEMPRGRRGQWNTDEVERNILPSDSGRMRSIYKCVYTNEWDKYAAQVYKKHYGECDTRDITKVPSSDIPDFDLLVGGFPCQSFSIAGKRRGFQDTRGTLFFDIVRILADKRPRYLLLENVKGLLNHESGKTFQTILRVLSDLGYVLQWEVLNSKNFGVPQNRERVFIIGCLGKECFRKVFPIEGSNPEANGKVASTAIDGNYWKGVDNHGQRTMIEITKNVSDAQRIYDSNGIAKTLKGLGGGMGAKTGMYAVPVLTPDRLKKRQNGRRFKDNGEPSFTLTGQDIHGVMTDRMKIRRLTPTECMRLQGFPDDWCDFGANGEAISDTQKYKMAGNAVSTTVVEYIGRKLLESIDE